MQLRNTQTRGARTGLALLIGLLVLTPMLGIGSATAAPAAKPVPPAAKPAPPRRQVNPLTDQVVPGAPLNITVSDDTQMDIEYRDLGAQFYGHNAEDANIWANVGGTTTVFGPASVPAGRSANPAISFTPPGGGDGTVVTIQGSGFTPGSHLVVAEGVPYAGRTGAQEADFYPLYSPVLAVWADAAGTWTATYRIAGYQSENAAPITTRPMRLLVLEGPSQHVLVSAPFAFVTPTPAGMPATGGPGTAIAAASGLGALGVLSLLVGVWMRRPRVARGATSRATGSTPYACYTRPGLS